MLYDLSNLYAEVMWDLDKIGLIKGNEKLEQIYTYAEEAHAIIYFLDSKFNQQFSAPTGSVVFDHTKDKSEIYGKIEFYGANGCKGNQIWSCIKSNNDNRR